MDVRRPCRDLRRQPLPKRQASLQALLQRFGCPVIALSEPLDDGRALLCVAEQRGLEGVVSKHRDAPYRSGSAGTVNALNFPLSLGWHL